MAELGALLFFDGHNWNILIYKWITRPQSCFVSLSETLYGSYLFCLMESNKQQILQTGIQFNWWLLKALKQMKFSQALSLVTTSCWQYELQENSAQKWPTICTYKNV